MKNKYIAPETQVRCVNIEPFIVATTTANNQNTMRISNDNPITRSEDILTKGRSFYDEENPFGIGEW